MCGLRGKKVKEKRQKAQRHKAEVSKNPGPEDQVFNVKIKTTRKVYPMSIKTKSLVILISLGIMDVVIPIPILGVILIYVVLQRPPWFTNVVREIYNTR